MAAVSLVVFLVSQLASRVQLRLAVFVLLPSIKSHNHTMIYNLHFILTGVSIIRDGRVRITVCAIDSTCVFVRKINIYSNTIFFKNCRYIYIISSKSRECQPPMNNLLVSAPLEHLLWPPLLAEAQLVLAVDPKITTRPSTIQRHAHTFNKQLYLQI